jgi:hypothetical protein
MAWPVFNGLVFNNGTLQGEEGRLVGKLTNSGPGLGERDESRGSIGRPSEPMRGPDTRIWQSVLVRW